MCFYAQYFKIPGLLGSICEIIEGVSLVSSRETLPLMWAVVKNPGPADKLPRVLFLMNRHKLAQTNTMFMLISVVIKKETQAKRFTNC